jgi:hypothetical protein
MLESVAAPRPSVREITLHASAWNDMRSSFVFEVLLALDRRNEPRHPFKVLSHGPLPELHRPQLPRADQQCAPTLHSEHNFTHRVSKIKIDHQRYHIRTRSCEESGRLLWVYRSLESKMDVDPQVLASVYRHNDILVRPLFLTCIGQIFPCHPALWRERGY